MVISNKKKSLFLDRDGVINIDFKYVYKYEDIVYVEGIFELVKYFNDLNYHIFVITNQSGISRDFYSENDVKKLHSKMDIDFKKKTSSGITHWIYCKHHPSENCLCRKPNLGMIQNLMSNYNIDLQNSILIGDKISDFELGIRAKIKNIYILKSNYLNNQQIRKINVNHSVIESLHEVINNQL